MRWKQIRIGDFLKRSKIPIDIEDSRLYKRVTIRTKHQGVSVRDTENGKKIGTKKQFSLRAGQFVLSKIDARYGAFGIAPNEVEGAIITGNFWAYDVDKSQMNIDWFNQYTNSTIFYDLCERASSGITHRKYLDERFFLDHELLIPDIDEQEVHVKLIEEKKASIGSLDIEHSTQLDFLQKLRQQILQDGIQGKLVSQDSNDEPACKLLERIKAEKEKLIREKKIKKDKPLPEIKPEEIPYEIPERWEWCRLGDICGFITKGTTPSLEKIKPNEKIPFLKVYNIAGQKINFEYKPQFIDEDTHNNILTRSIVYPNDVLMNIVGPPLGKVAIVPNSFLQWNINQALVRFRPLVIEISSFLYFYLCEGSEIKKLVPLGVVGQDNLSLEQCRNLIFPLPPLSEQHRIVIQIDQLMKLCDEFEHSILQSQKYTEELLQVALKEALEPKKQINSSI